MPPRWVFPGVATVVFMLIMFWTKDSMPWPIYIGAALGFVCCAGLTMLVHQADKGARRR